MRGGCWQILLPRRDRTEMSLPRARHVGFGQGDRLAFTGKRGGDTRPGLVAANYQSCGRDGN